MTTADGDVVLVCLTQSVEDSLC